MTIIIKPIITEKATAQGEKQGRYAFQVSKDANKIEIKKAVEAAYGVTVEAVNTINVIGKNKSRYTKAGLICGKESDVKKAIVTLKQGDAIDFYSNI